MTNDRRSEAFEHLFLSFLNTDKAYIYNSVVLAMKNAGFEMQEQGNDFNVIWTGQVTT